MSDLPDMYTQSLRACGPWALDVHIGQTTNAHGITVMCHNTPGEQEAGVLWSSSQSVQVCKLTVFIGTVAGNDCGFSLTGSSVHYIYSKGYTL